MASYPTSPLRMPQLLAGLRAIAEPTRIRLFALCDRADLTVTDLTELLKQSQPRISRHLKIMCDAEILERVQEGTFAFYRVSPGGAGAILARQLMGLIELSPADERNLESLKTRRHKLAAPFEAANAEQLKKLAALYPSEKIIDEALMRALPSEDMKDLLDIGTGTGHMLSLFGPKVTHAVGIDLSRQMLSVARANLMLSDLQNCRVQQADMYHLPVDAASFDAVTVHHVLHFAEHPEDVIMEAARVLRPGGKLVVVDFAPHQLQKMKTEFGHVWMGFSEKDLEEWCAAAHLELQPVTKLSESGKPLQVIIAAARRDARKLPKKKSAA